MPVVEFVEGAGRTLGVFGGDTVVPGGPIVEHRYSDAQVAMRLLFKIRKLGLAVQAADIRFEGGKATVFGVVNGTADRERLVMAVGNTPLVARVDDQIQVREENNDSDSPPCTWYEVQRGDTLRSIAADRLDSEGAVSALLEANRPVLDPSGTIFPGEFIRLPAAP